MKKRTNSIVLFTLALSATAFMCCVQTPHFDEPHSTVLYASDGTLLSAITADDGQWRFPEVNEVPDKFRHALLLFEDQHFHDHNGIYLPSILRALAQNVRSGRVVSGGSTLTMQVIRLSRKNPPRTPGEKLLEMLLALRMELSCPKEEILALYASHAPFGGNVVGLEAASWRYYGHPASELTWAESATLAVLPNAPSLIFPGRNQEKLLRKRNTLLRKLFLTGAIDEETLELSYLEPLPGKPLQLPRFSPHLLTTLCAQYGKGKIYHTTIDPSLQIQTSAALQRHIQRFEPSHVHNAAALIIEVKSGNVLAYAGNVTDELNRHSNQVDVIPARRSTGSILKPFLYASMLHDGLILPETLVPDIPIQFDGFSPKNYSETFDGAVPASLSLSRSLNIPSVIMLREYGYARFYHQLKKFGFSHLDQPASHYGLSLILGGAEASLWDVCHAYAGMSRTLTNYTNYSQYDRNEYERRQVLSEKKSLTFQRDDYPPLNAGSIYCTFQSLLKVNRPDSELGWENYSSYSPIAWKSGTSFGNRDAWAVGTNPDYVIGIWVGNADGQGRPELTGVRAAAPLLFELFGILPTGNWFIPPMGELSLTPVCRIGGMLASSSCTEVDTLLVPASGSHSSACRFHTLIHLDPTGSHRVNANCAEPYEMRQEAWFVLPGVQEYYYRSKHPEYKLLPPYAPGCDPNDHSPISIIYPKSNSPLFIPRNITGVRERTVLKASHRNPGATIYWHLDKQYLGASTNAHEMEIAPEAGDHQLTLVDDEGNSVETNLKIIAR